MIQKNIPSPKIPKLRFQEFQNEWREVAFGKLVKRAGVSVEVDPLLQYREIGIRSHGKGIFHKELISGKDLGNKRVFWIEGDVLVLNIVFAWEQAIAITTKAELGMVGSHRFPMYRPKTEEANLDYLLKYFLTKKGTKLLELASPGGAGRNKTLGQKLFENSILDIPSVPEQEKISKFLSLVEKKIEKLKLKKELAEKYKKGVAKMIFSKEIKFKDENKNDFPAWKEKELGKLLDYEQPTKYLVESKEYKDTYKTPVLTAGKTFILGYTNETKGIFNKGLPVIIFDDFTTASQFVDFPFKAKSSAMKILSTIGDNDIRFLYEVMQQIQYKIGGHGRHWISVFAKKPVFTPSIEEQRKIASFLSGINAKIDSISLQIKQAELWKKGLLQNMFV